MVKILFEECIKVDNRLLFFAYNANALYSFDLSTKELRFVLSLPEECPFGQRLIGKLILYNDILYLLPMATKQSRIWLFNIKSEELSFVDLKMEGIYLPYERVADAYVYNDKLFMVGCYYHGIIVMNLNNLDVEYFQLGSNNRELFSLFSCAKKENLIFIPSPIEAKVVVFDMNTCSYRKDIILTRKNNFCGCLFDGNKIMLFPYGNGKIVYLQENFKECYYDLPNEIAKYKERLFRAVREINNKFLVIGLQDVESFWLEKNNPHNYSIVQERLFSANQLDINTYILQNINGLVLYKNENGSEQFSFEMGKERALLVSNMRENTYIYEENEKVNLQDFIDCVL